MGKSCCKLDQAAKSECLSAAERGRKHGLLPRGLFRIAGWRKGRIGPQG